MWQAAGATDLVLKAVWTRTHLEGGRFPSGVATHTSSSDVFCAASQGGRGRRTADTAQAWPSLRHAQGVERPQRPRSTAGGNALLCKLSDISKALLISCEKGKHVISNQGAYGRTASFLQATLPCHPAGPCGLQNQNQKVLGWSWTAPTM